MTERPAPERSMTEPMQKKNPRQIWESMYFSQQTAEDAKLFEKHVGVVGLPGKDGATKYYVVLSDVKPEAEKQYLHPFHANPIPIHMDEMRRDEFDMDEFLNQVATAHQTQDLPTCFNPNNSEIFEIPD